MTSILRIAIPSSMPTCLDYLPNEQRVQLGMRVKVPLRGRDCVGIVISKAQHTEVPIEKLKPITRLIDKKAVIPADLLSLLKWVSRYYHYPIGGVLKVALPHLLCSDKSLPPGTIEVWRVCQSWAQDAELSKARFQATCIAPMAGQTRGCRQNTA